MSTAPSPEVGDTISVTVTKRDGDGNGEIVVIHPDRPYDFLLSAAPALEDGERMELTVTVTKTWYSTSGTLETLTVAPPETVSTVHEKNAGMGRERECDTARAESPQSQTAGTDDSLRAIAADLIGDEELDVTDDEESLVGAARRVAKNQGRDPAIDPRLTDLE